MRAYVCVKICGGPRRHRYLYLHVPCPSDGRDTWNQMKGTPLKYLVGLNCQGGNTFDLSSEETGNYLSIRGKTV